MLPNLLQSGQCRRGQSLSFPSFLMGSALPDLLARSQVTGPTPGCLLRPRPLACSPPRPPLASRPSCWSPSLVWGCSHPCLAFGAPADPSTPLDWFGVSLLGSWLEGSGHSAHLQGMRGGLVPGGGVSSSASLPPVSLLPCHTLTLPGSPLGPDSIVTASLTFIQSKCPSLVLLRSRGLCSCHTEPLWVSARRGLCFHTPAVCSGWAPWQERWFPCFFSHPSRGSVVTTLTSTRKALACCDPIPPGCPLRRASPRPPYVGIVHAHALPPAGGNPEKERVHAFPNLQWHPAQGPARGRQVRERRLTCRALRYYSS